MGRGLSAILPTKPDDATHDQLRMLPPAAIDVNPNQPRKTFDADELAALADSIRANGVLQPLLVRPLDGDRYELIAGERRLRAARLAEVISVPTYVRADRDGDNLELALIENMARVDLNPIDAARACATLVDDLNLTKEEVARRVGKSRVAVSNLIRLLNLPDEVIALLESGSLSEGHGRAILRTTDHFARRRLAQQALDNGWSVRETERQAEILAGDGPNRKLEGEGSPGSSRRTLDAEIREATSAVAERFADRIGSEPSVKITKRGVQVRLDFDDVDQALEFAERIERS